MAERTLGQIIAVERAMRKKDDDEGSRFKREVQKEKALAGMTKTYVPNDEDAPVSERREPEYTEVQVRVEDVLNKVRSYTVPAVDVTATKDRTNQNARANITVNGQVIATDVPISHLLWLEKTYLPEMRGFFAVLPTLDPTRRWTWDEGRGVYVSAPEETARSLKEEVPLILAPATKEHQAVPKTVIKETPVGKYTTIHLSGAVTATRKQEILDRMDTLRLAVKDAIARANRTTAIEVHEGDALMDYLLG